MSATSKSQWSDDLKGLSRCQNVLIDHWLSMPQVGSVIAIVWTFHDGNQNVFLMFEFQIGQIFVLFYFLGKQGRRENKLVHVNIMRIDVILPRKHSFWTVDFARVQKARVFFFDSSRWDLFLREELCSFRNSYFVKHSQSWLRRQLKNFHFRNSSNEQDWERGFLAVQMQIYSDCKACSVFHVSVHRSDKYWTPLARRTEKFVWSMFNKQAGWTLTSSHQISKQLIRGNDYYSL